MNAPQVLPTMANTMADVQNLKDTRQIAINRVGIKSIRHPVKVLDRSGGIQHTIAVFSMYVGLPHNFKGTHMSRFVEILNSHDREISVENFPTMLRDMVEKLEAETGHIEMNFPYFINKAAPVSGVQSLMDYDVILTGEICHGEIASTIKVVVPVTSLCPCSKKISELGNAVSLVLDGGACQVGIESTILDLSRGQDFAPRILRPGHITAEQIALVIGIQLELPAAHAAGDAPRVSGSLDGHYAPLTALRLVDTAALPELLIELQKRGTRVGLLTYCRGVNERLWPARTRHPLPDEPEGYARGLYAALRELDQQGNELIVVERIPDTAAWAAVADRLRRSTCGSGAA